MQTQEQAQEAPAIPIHDGGVAPDTGGSNSQDTGLARPTVRELRRDPWCLESDGDGKIIANSSMRT